MYQVRNERGHTLIEMLIVIAILAIISTAALTKGLKAGTDSAELSGASRELVSNLRLIRTKAISENKSYRFEIAGDERSYSFYEADSNELYEKVELRNGIKIYCSGYKFNFASNGNVQLNHNIYLTCPNGLKKQVSVNYLGLVELKN